MTIEDKNKMFCAMVSWNTFKSWAEDTSSEMPPQDKQKMRIVAKTILELLRQFGKREGKEALEALLEESKNFTFLIAHKDEEVGNAITGSFDETIYKTAIKGVLKHNDIECAFCERCDFKNCEWFALRKLAEQEPTNSGKGCPFSSKII